MTWRRWLLITLACGGGFAAEGIAFVALSLFSNIDRSAWVVLNQLKGVVGFSLCGLAGFLIVRGSGNLRSAALAGLAAGFLAGCIVPLSMYVLAYGGLSHLRQYPFEHYSMLQSGLSDPRDYLLSDRGHATVFETTIGLMPIVATWALVQGAILGVAGGFVARWWNKPTKNRLPSRER